MSAAASRSVAPLSTVIRSCDITSEISIERRNVRRSVAAKSRIRESDAASRSRFETIPTSFV